MSNRVGVALFDLLLVGVALWWVGAIMIDIAGHRSFPRVFLRIFARTITAAAVVYLAFAAMWGLNYRRLPLTARIKFDERAITPAASRDLARQAADEANGRYVAAHSELALTGGATGRSLESGFDGGAERASHRAPGASRRVRSGRSSIRTSARPASTG